MRLVDFQFEPWDSGFEFFDGFRGRFAVGEVEVFEAGELGELLHSGIIELGAGV